MQGGRTMKVRRALIACVAALAAGPAAAADAYTFAPGYAGGDFATGFPTGEPFGLNGTPVGPWGLEFDPDGTLFVADRYTRELYAFGPGGGVADASTRRGTIDQYLAADLAFDRAGRLYTARSGPSNWDIVEISPQDAHVIRTVVTLADAQYVKGMKIDPLSGDLFVLIFANGNTSSVGRVTLPPTGQGELTPYAAIPGNSQVDGLVFTRAGTMFANSGDDVFRIDGSDRPQPATVTKVAVVPNGDGMAVDQTTDPLNPAYILVNRNDGRITRVDFTADGPVYGDIVTGGSRGDSATVGPDGCLYATQTSTVLKVTKADGTCALTPVTAFPPDAVTGAASDVSQTAATVAGTVDPNGYETTAHFEYGTDPAALSSRTPDQAVGRGSDPVALTAALAGLRAGTTYWFRVVATSGTGSVHGVIVQFTTAAAAPVPTTTPAPTPTPTPPAVLPAVRVNPLPASRRCVSRRRFKIRLRVPRGTRIARAKVFLNGKRLAVRRSDRLRAVVNLRGLPKGRFKVRISLVLDDGRRVKGTRTYRTCVPGRRPSGRASARR